MGQCEESPITPAFVALRRTLSHASSLGVTCCDDKNRSIPTAPRGVNAHGSLFSSVFLERARGLRCRRVHVRRSHGHVLDRALQQLGHRSIPHPKNLGRIRLQSQDLRIHAKHVQRRSTSVVGLVAGSSSEGLGHAAGQLQCSIAKSTVAQEIASRLRLVEGEDSIKLRVVAAVPHEGPSQRRPHPARRASYF
jgi:hypothetical protein